MDAFAVRDAQNGGGGTRCPRLGTAGVCDVGPRRRAVGPWSREPSSRDANAARRHSDAPYIDTPRLLGAQWNRLELLCPNLSKHCAQPRLFRAADVPV